MGNPTCRPGWNPAGLLGLRNPARDKGAIGREREDQERQGMNAFYGPPAM